MRGKGCIAQFNRSIRCSVILKSRSIPIVTDLYEPNNLDLNYPELLRKCSEVEVNISKKEIEMASRTQELMRRGQEFLVS